MGAGFRVSTGLFRRTVWILISIRDSDKSLDSSSVEFTVCMAVSMRCFQGVLIVDIARYFPRESVSCDYCASVIKPFDPAYREPGSSIVGCSQACCHRAVTLLEGVKRRNILRRGLVQSSLFGEE